MRQIHLKVQQEGTDGQLLLRVRAIAKLSRKVQKKPFRIAWGRHQFTSRCKSALFQHPFTQKIIRGINCLLSGPAHPCNPREPGSGPRSQHWLQFSRCITKNSRENRAIFQIQIVDSLFCQRQDKDASHKPRRRLYFINKPSLIIKEPGVQTIPRNNSTG